VREAGGLYVLGSERHESRRIDNQLRGRAGRQGDPGESRFYLSLEDDLMRLFATGAMNWVMGRALPEDVPIEAKMVTKAIERAQNTVEGRNSETRKEVLKYDEVMNEQRKVIYALRLQVIDGEDLEERTGELLDGAIESLVASACPSDYPKTGSSTGCSPRSSSTTRPSSCWRTWPRPRAPRCCARACSTRPLAYYAEHSASLPAARRPPARSSAR